MAEPGGWKDRIEDVPSWLVLADNDRRGFVMANRYSTEVMHCITDRFAIRKDMFCQVTRSLHLRVSNTPTSLDTDSLFPEPRLSDLD